MWITVSGVWMISAMARLEAAVLSAVRPDCPQSAGTPSPAAVSLAAGPQPRLASRLGNLGEAGGVEGGTAHQRAVDVGACQKLFGVVGLDAAAVENTSLFAEVRVQGGQPLADGGVDFLGLLGGGDLARADGPDRLVGDHAETRILQ